MSPLLCLLPLATAPPKTEVTVWVSRNIAPSAKVRVNLNTRNVPTINVSAYPVDGAKWLISSHGEEAKATATGPALRSWTMSVANKGQRPNPRQADTYYSRQVNLPAMKPGVYLLVFSGGGQRAQAVVNVTDLAVVVKRSSRRALVWVTDFRTGAVVPNAAVTAYRKNGEAVRRTKTGADGAVMVELAPGQETFVVRRGEDLAGVPTAQVDPDGQLRAHFQTDRPIYRPGQKVSFKAILRRTLGTEYAAVAGKPCTVQIRDPKDTPLDEIRLTSSAMGTLSGAFEIPEEGMTGPYTLVLQAGGESAYGTITVAAYRKPEFKVEVRSGAKRYLAGDEVRFEIDTATYFGSPVAQAAVHYRIRRSSMGFDGGDASDRLFYSGDGNLYARDTYANDAVVGEDTVYTDANGKATIRLKTDPKVGDSTLSFSCDVTDGARRQVQGASSVPVYGASIRLGLSTSLAYASLGSLVPVTVRAMDLDGKPVAATVSITLKSRRWDEKKEEWRDRVVTQTSLKVPTSGRANINLPAREAGDLTIEVTAQDSTRHTARAGLAVYVAGNFDAVAKEQEEPTVGLRLDKRVYEPGDKAKAFVQSNHPRLPILLVAEGGDLWDYRVLPNAKASRTWILATSARLSPNAYVTAQQWVKEQLVSANVLLPIPDRSKALKVEAVPDRKEYRPGDRATYTVRTTDAKGKPVSAEVALSVVDEAIYALSPDTTPDLYGHYWGLRPNAIQTQSSAPEEVSGGAYQRVGTVAPVRQRFEDTAYWGPTVVTDAKGLATVAFEMPGNLTAWRATVRGITLDTRAGTGTASVLANRPVTLRLATPRQMVQGDRLTIIGTVNNRSDVEHEFETELVAEGVTLEGAPRPKVRIPARSQGQVQWTLLAPTMPATGEAKLTARVVATDNRTADFADALQVGLRVVPNGLAERTLAGGTVGREAEATLVLPEDRIEPATTVSVEIRGGLLPELRETAKAILASPRYGSIGAANQLEAAVATGLGNGDKAVRESLALLSRTQRYDGWGRWESAATDPVVTARIASALGTARTGGIRVFDSLLRTAKGAVEARYNATNLWEHRAQLAAAAVLVENPKGRDLVQEVSARGVAMSPYARLRLAEAMRRLNRKEDAIALVRGVLEDAPIGPAETFVPAGEGVEWSATDIETTAEALAVMSGLELEPQIQASLARWLVAPEQAYRSGDEDAAVVRALAFYLKGHTESDRLGPVTVEVNGTPVEVKPSSVTDAATARVPRELLRSGANRIVLRRTGDGQAFYRLDARVYRPAPNESTEGVRVLRRYEVKNAGGTWVELDRPVRPGEPVRCTTVAWGDDIRDALKVVEPLPAGFEFVEDETGAEGYQEVRDGAVIHYLTNSGQPQTFRYHLRAESEGTLVALPATAEYLRRPRMRGHSVPVRVVVEAGG